MKYLIASDHAGFHLKQELIKSFDYEWIDLGPENTDSVDYPDYGHKLAEAIRETLSAAILMGGTTLRDFVNSDGKPGYFAQSLLVYGKAGAPCTECNTPLKEIRMNNRSTVYCPRCQR